MLYAELKDEEALKLYADHPVHVECVRNSLSRPRLLIEPDEIVGLHRYKNKTVPFTTGKSGRSRVAETRRRRIANSFSSRSECSVSTSRARDSADILDTSHRCPRVRSRRLELYKMMQYLDFRLSIKILSLASPPRLRSHLGPCHASSDGRGTLEGSLWSLKVARAWR